jgi:hypothetical protein
VPAVKLQRCGRGSRSDVADIEETETGLLVSDHPP